MQITIDENAANQRFDRYLRKYFKPYKDIKLAEIFGWIRRGEILVNNKKVKENYRLILGDEIKFKNIETGKKAPNKISDSKEEKMRWLKLDKINPMITYEDTNWLVFDKPAGVVLHGGNKHETDLTMNDYLEIATSALTSATFKPAFGYRLDKDTSGILIAAKTYDALQYLNKIIRERKIDKYYLALVVGKTPVRGEIDVNLEKGYDKKHGKARVSVKKNGERTAKTTFETIQIINHKALGEISLLKVKIYTGRMHQIRVHLAHIGFPVLGDLMYGNPAINRKLYKVLKINRQLLHCWRYMFWDPYSKQNIEFEAKIPKDFETITE